MSYAADYPQRRDIRMQRVYLRRRVTVFGIALIVLFGLFYVIVAAAAPMASASAVASVAASRIVAPAVTPAWPADGSAAVGIVGQDAALGQHGSLESIPIASITKTITALMVLQKKPIAAGSNGPTITFTQADVDVLHQVWAEDGSWANVDAGEKQTEKQALTTMLLPSANNYAISLAKWAYGSVGAYNKAANAWLAQQGFTHTHMTDPSGLDPGTVSNVTDLLGIAKLVVADPVLSQIVATQTATTPGAGDLENGNKLLGQDGIDGIKTGFTDQAGHCLMFSATATIFGQTRTIVGVMTGQQSYDDLWSGVPALLDSMKKGFNEVPLTTAKTSFGSYTAPWGDSTSLVASKKLTAEVWSSTPIQVRVDASKLRTASAGQPVGTVSFSYDGTKVSSPLKTTKALRKPSFGWRLLHPGDLF